MPKKWTGFSTEEHTETEVPAYAEPNLKPESIIFLGPVAQPGQSVRLRTERPRVQIPTGSYFSKNRIL